MKRQVYTPNAPKPVGPYSQAVVYRDLIFLSGQIGIDPTTGNLKEGLKEQFLQCLKNVESILSEVGSSKEKILRVVIYLTDLDQFKLVNEVYEEFFRDVEVKPARTTVGVDRLPLNAFVEVEVTAHL
ncbi:RidA family protein [Thermocrinis minervae]|uniref:2-iminobutanoate/2-iminopropanoate deaminase n=1 Tax=Thermocrinis minervae TaxID=381751 RepID=A0A1M6T2C5_9AQUI|nr:Rid family detoxifying hydrolase [Thermocrinis minervae]SHK51080.1 2-iminobutanoate/2-iminopropanoate deaminase [Thermocrinis minervae]